MILIELYGNTYSKRNPVKVDGCEGCAFLEKSTCSKESCYPTYAFPEGAIYKRHYSASEVANNIRNK